MKNTKHLKIGMYTVSVAAVAVIIAVLVNMLIGYIPTQFTKLDTSGLDLVEIGDETETIVKSVDSDVVLYLIVEEGMQDMYVTTLLDRYASINSRITVKEIDPILHPTFTTPCGQEYSLGEYEENTVIVAGTERDKVIPYSEIFQTEYSDEDLYYYYYYGQEPAGTTSFYGEAKLTGAIGYVAGEDVSICYILEGHGETALGTNLSTYIDDDNYTVSTLSLLTVSQVPQDAGCIIINNPTSDINSEELTLLTDYVKNGGKVILVTGFNGYSITQLPNVCALGAAFGINALEGLAVEGNSNNAISGYPYYLLPNVSSHTITDAISNMYALMPLSHGLEIAEDTEGVSHSALLTTSSSAYATSGETIDQSDAVFSGQMYVGVMAEVSAESDTGLLVWYASPGITDDTMDSYVSGGNSTLFLSTLSYACDKGNSVSIAAKSMAVDTLVVDEGSANTWSTVIIFVIPLAIVIPGFVYWLYRRKK